MRKNFNDTILAKTLLEEIRELAKLSGTIRIMEVCGTHTMAIGRFGLRRILPKEIQLISGPGCPVCVTPAAYIDNAVSVAKQYGCTLATFGDMIRVPGAETSLEQARAEGVSIAVLTTPLEVLRLPAPVMMLAVGFETTIAPLVAVMHMVYESGRDDITFYTSCKVVPPTLQLLATDLDIGLDAFLLPGHVSAIIGSDAYNDCGLPGCIAGFELIEILSALRTLLKMKTEQRIEILNEYSHVVTPAGNQKACQLIHSYMEPSSQLWRGLGELPACSLAIRPKYARIDAENVYDIPPLTSDTMPEGCACGEVLKGRITPFECPLFSTVCTPDSPTGPCMVSSEGSCASYYKYERVVQ